MDENAQSAPSMSPPQFKLANEEEAVQRQAEPGVAAEATEEVHEHLSLREGFRRNVYLDSRGLPTAGTGHLLSRAERARYPVGARVPDEVLERWRIEDSENAYAAAVQMGIDIEYESQDLVNALTAVNFQLGTAWNQEHRRTWGYLQNHDWVNAAREAADSSWFTQTPVRVLDFQRVLLNIAGENTDYQSLLEFNAAQIQRRGVTFPSQRNVEAFEVHAHTAPGQQAGAGDGAGAGQQQGTTEEKSSDTEKSAAPTSNITRAVGVKEDGSYTGTKADIATVQQLLINAGMLPAETLGRSGSMVSNADGLLGSKTIQAIKDFQSQIMGWNAKSCDGRIDVGGKTWAKLASFTSAPTVVEDNASGESESGSGEEITPPENGTVREETKSSDESSQSDVGESETAAESETSGPASVETVTYDQIPTSFGNQIKISGPVGQGGSNTATDMDKIKLALRMAGYRTDLLEEKGTAAQKRRKRMVQLKNAIFHFQSTYSGELSTDGRVDPNGATWRKLVEVAFKNSGGQPMSEERLNEVHQQRKGSSGDVPSDLSPGITNGHLVGIDNSGYLLPEEFRPGARRLTVALNTIKEAIGNYRISCGYRSPEHNVKIGSTASKSQHVQGIAADIQSNGQFGPNALKRKLIQMMDDGLIPKGGVGLYSWGCHYDIRGTKAIW
ncbi:MAG: D-Ala-D-Ala carboxypeptidase family metallohydrolase [Bacteroidota bacterium]